MVNVPCPKCNHPNPPDTDICLICGASLTIPAVDAIHPGEDPVRKVTAALDKVSTPGDKKAIHPGEFPTKKDTGDLERALPTWLQSVRKGEDEKPGAVTPADAQPGETTEPGGASADDLLAGLAHEKDEEEVVPDWLAGLSQEKESEEEVPDWLASIRGKVEKDVEITPSEESPVPSGEDAQALPPADDGQPAEAEEAAFPATEIPEWLSEFKKDEPVAAASTGEDEAESEEIGKWLKGLDGSAEASPAPVFPAANDEPEWLSRLKEEAPAAESSADAIPTDIPDWLSGIPAVPLPAEEENRAGTAQDLPDATSEAESAAGEPVIPAAEAESQPPPDNVPDWLSELKIENTPEPPAAAFTPGTEPVEEEKNAEPLPDWLAGIKDAGSGSSATPALIQDQGPGPAQAEPAGAFSMEEQPDWLSNLKPESKEKTFESKEPEEEDRESLEKVDLPSWVQAMRPVESVVDQAAGAIEASDQPVEEGGPLAGLRGVLPAIASLGALQKPPAYSIKLQVDDSQQAHAARLERLITNEAEPARLKDQGRILPARILRWIITLVLLLVIGGTIASGATLVPEQTLYPPEMISAMNVISEMGTNAPILVVFDYQPALSGEMEAAAAPLIDHILYTGARLTLLSTTPTGPALAERFLQNTQAGHQYQAGEQYVNLGYLSGGPAGMLDFAQNPALASPLSTNGQPAWDSTPLEGIQTMRDYAAVVILTDDSDVGRAWIEQAGTILGDTPMLMVISAQAEPMIRPYYDSGQIQGLITGLAGGKAYEDVTQIKGAASQYWNAFSTGMLAAIIMIIAGATWSAILTWRERRAGQEVKA